MNAEHKHVVFRLGPDFFGLPIESVERILNAQTVTRVPQTPAMVMGVFELRGETLPAVDLRARFNLEIDPSPGQFIVVAQEGGSVAVRVDAVDGIAVLDDSKVEPPQDWLKEKEDDFVLGVAQSEGRLVLILRPEHLIPANVRKSLNKGKTAAPALRAA